MGQTVGAYLLRRLAEWDGAGAPPAPPVVTTPSDPGMRLE